MASEKLQQKLNEQITHELGAELQYLAMSFWFERENLNGMCNCSQRSISSRCNAIDLFCASLSGDAMFTR